MVVVVMVVVSLVEPRGTEAKDCMESNKGAAGSGIKKEVCGQGLNRTVAKKASHQIGNDRWWVAVR